MDLLRALLLGSAAIALSGCGTLIFDADFDQLDGAVGSPVGSVPGAPAGDFIVAEGDLRFAKIAGNALTMIQPGAGTPTGGYTGRLYLGSAVADNASRRTVAWTGRFTGDSAFDTAPLAVDISAQQAGMTVEPWPNQHLRLNLSNSDAELRDASGNLLQSPSPLPPGQNHSVFVSLRPVDATYRITIQHPAQAEILWTGPLPAGTVALLTSNPRLLLRLGFPEGNTSASISAYAMDDVLMRARD